MAGEVARAGASVNTDPLAEPDDAGVRDEDRDSSWSQQRRLWLPRKGDADETLPPCNAFCAGCVRCLNER